MPKARLSNDKGLVQSSGNGLQLTPTNAAGAGMHFKTAEVDIGSLGITLNATDNGLVAYTGITLPAHSVVLGVSAVVTELRETGEDLDLSLALDDNHTALSLGATLSGGEILATINASHDDQLNGAFGAFLDTGIAVAANVDVCLINAGGSNTAAAVSKGKIVVTVIYAGVES